MGQRVLITGITGMVGSHLADYFLSEHPEIEVVGIKRWRSDLSCVSHLINKVRLIDCDMMDATSVFRTIRATRPDFIFHLAAQSYVLDSWSHPHATLQGNIEMQLNLFEAVRACELDPVIQLALSSEEYGKVFEHELPINEDNPLRPLSPYAVSKVGQDMLGYQYFESYGLRCIRTRTFNHEGPRRGEVFVTSNFARQIAEIELEMREPVVYTGNTESRRDWTDVRDVVRAYWLSTQHCTPGDVYVIGSGTARTVQSMLDTLLSFSKVKIEVKVDPARLRPSDVLVLQGDPTKFKKATGWEPAIPFEKTMSDLLDYWRHKLRVANWAATNLKQI